MGHFFEAVSWRRIPGPRSHWRNLLFLLCWSLALGILLAADPHGILWNISLGYMVLALVVVVKTFYGYQQELLFLREFHHLSQTLDDFRLLDFERPFRRILESVLRICGFDRAVLFLVDDDQQHLDMVQSVTLAGGKAGSVRFPRDSGFQVPWHVIDCREPMIVRDVTSLSSLLEVLPGVKPSDSLGLVPIMRGKVAYGLILVTRQKDQGPLEDEDLLQLQVLADQVAISLQNLRLHEELSVRAELLLRQRERTQRELNLAKVVQDGVLPRTAPKWPALQIAQFLQPARFIGGDFYRFLEGCRSDCHPCGKESCEGCQDQTFGLLIGDVAGKGIPAAMVMAVVASLFHEKSTVVSCPEELMTSVNVSLKTFLGSESRFHSSAFVGFFHPLTKAFAFANAGHDFPLLYSAQTGEITSLESTGTLLGVFIESTFGRCDLTLNSGDRLLFYTDGLLEAFEQVLGHEDGLVDLELFLRDNATLSADEFIGKIGKLVAEIPGEQTDDITAIIVAVD